MKTATKLMLGQTLPNDAIVVAQRGDVVLATLW